jgi:hypothetical protein
MDVQTPSPATQAVAGGVRWYVRRCYDGVGEKQPRLNENFGMPETEQ